MKPYQPVDSSEAHERARAMGLKAAISVHNTVRCPEIPPPAGDVSALAARGAYAALIVDVDGFLRPDIDVAEAVALLGPPVLCSRVPGQTCATLHLAPSAPAVHEAVLETRGRPLAWRREPGTGHHASCSLDRALIHWTTAPTRAPT